MVRGGADWQGHRRRDHRRVVRRRRDRRPLSGAFFAGRLAQSAGRTRAMLSCLMAAAAAQAALGLTSHPVMAGAALATSSFAFGV
jgi:hypothetical protein